MEFHTPPFLRRAVLAVCAVFESLPSLARRQWKTMAAGVGVLMVVSVALLSYALQARTPESTVEIAAEDPITVTNDRERALDGVMVHPSSTRLLPIGVMVENSSDAWPLQGPAKAQLVFEAPVEGSITRLLLLFDASSTVAEIGPVRSARPYYVDWADGLGALYAHVGGSPEALTRIVAINVSDLNEFYNGWAFWRATSRAAPHNVFTRMDLLLQAAERKTFVPGSFEGWTYADMATSTPAAEAVETIHVPYEGVYAADWVYDAMTGLYTRHYSSGAVVRDADGTAVTATNVVVLLTESTVLDDVGRLRVRTTGSGRARVFTRGGMRDATWSRAAGAHVQFSGIDGTDVAFSRGATWITVVTRQEQFERVRPE